MGGPAAARWRRQGGRLVRALCSSAEWARSFSQCSDGSQAPGRTRGVLLGQERKRTLGQSPQNPRCRRWKGLHACTKPSLRDGGPSPNPAYSPSTPPQLPTPQARVVKGDRKGNFDLKREEEKGEMNAQTNWSVLYRRLHLTSDQNTAAGLNA